MDIPHLLNVGLHVAAGTTALIAGLAPLLSRKGSRAHRLSGRIFLGLGGPVIATAALACLLYSPPGPLVAATLAAAYQYVGGIRALHIAKGPGWPDMILASTSLAVVAWTWPMMTAATASWPPAVGYTVLGFMAATALYDLSRSAWRKVWLRYRAVDHGLKLTGAYFAMVSAGAGNLLPQLKPWSQFMPSVIGLGVMIALATVHVRRSGSRANAPPEPQADPIPATCA